MVEAAEPFQMHPTSMSYLYEVFAPLQLLRLGIWLHTHTVTTTDVPHMDANLLPYHHRHFPRFERVGSYDVSVQIMPLRYG
jgi:hypothetical protein